MYERQNRDPFQQRSLFGDSSSLDGAPPIVIENANARLAFLRRVYGWMFAGVLATVFGAGIAVKSGIAESMLTWGFLPRILLVVAWMFSAGAVAKVRKTPTWNVVAFASYAAFTGFVLSTIIYLAIWLAERNGANGATYLLQAGGLTLGAFAAISAYAFISKRDFSFMRGFLTVGSVVLLGALLIGFFVESTGYQIAISAAGVLLFSGFVLYDTSRVLKTVPDGEHVAGAMMLYLDFVMLFIYVLRLVLIIAGGGRRS
ncbi:MAG: Bax inhibitor-1/YccA family protein [Myxococcota bacterium]